MLLALAACTSPEPPPAPRVVPTTAPASPEPPRVPGQEWETADPDEVGLDPAVLTAADDTLGAMDSSCFAVVRDGRLAHETTWVDGPVPTYSITKSLTALLVAAAVHDGALAYDDPVSRWVPDWTGSAADITVRDLMAMTSGRRFTEATDREMIRSARDKTAYAIALPQERRPGEQWQYDNAAVQVLERVLRESTGHDVADLARDRLLTPLGMAGTTWARDAAGHATTYSGVSSTCTDLARMGLLVLREGSWVEMVVAPAGPLRESTPLNAAYGLLWWVNDEGTVVEVRRQAGAPTDVAPRQGRLAPSAPDDATWAFGHGFQYVMVVPSLDLVAVRLGRVPSDPTALTFEAFSALVTGAVR